MGLGVCLIGGNPKEHGTHSLRRTEATLTHRRWIDPRTARPVSHFSHRT